MSNLEYKKNFNIKPHFFFLNTIHQICVCACLHSWYSTPNHSTKTKTIFPLYLFYFSKQMSWTPRWRISQLPLEILITTKCLAQQNASQTQACPELKWDLNLSDLMLFYEISFMFDNIINPPKITYSQNLTVKLKQKYIWKMGRKTHLRFLRVLIFSAQSLFVSNVIRRICFFNNWFIVGQK